MGDRSVRGGRADDSVNRTTSPGFRNCRLPAIEVRLVQLAPLLVQLPYLVGGQRLAGDAEVGDVVGIRVRVHRVDERLSGGETRVIILAPVSEPGSALKFLSA